MHFVNDSIWSLEFAGADQIAGWDGDIARDVLGHFTEFAQARIAPLDPLGDEQGCRLSSGRVHLPDGFAQTYRLLAADGWQGLGAPEAFGGQGQGPAVQALISESFAGACHALQMICGLVPGAIRLLVQHATPDQRARFIPPLASGAWLASMCLTEADAGSDLSRIRTSGQKGPQGWMITGEKIFISGGDQDASDNILHLVLARTGPEGTGGLSLFACPAVLASGQRNAITVARLESKMGLHASPTCHMIFSNAQAELIGAPGQGLAAMFVLMNHARLDVALQGVAHAARAQAIAAAYAEGRVQGRGPDGKPVRLSQHPDVRRMLDQMDRQTLAARALAHTALVAIETDQQALADFMTPMAKVAGSEAGMDVTQTAMQVLGGYGYLREYRVEQAYRDARVCAIYEGANGIHAHRLATRGLLHSGGQQAQAFADYIEKIVQDHQHARLASALQQWIALCDHLRATDLGDRAHLLMQSSIALFTFGFWVRVADGEMGLPRTKPLVALGQRQSAQTVWSCLALTRDAETSVQYCPSSNDLEQAV